MVNFNVINKSDGSALLWKFVKGLWAALINFAITVLL